VKKDKSTVIKDINSILPKFWKVDRVVISNNIPKTPSMKIDRISLMRRCKD